MPPVAFNPSEPFEEEAPAATFDPKQPFEEAGDAPSFDPNSPFQEESATPAKPVKVDANRAAKRDELLKQKKVLQAEGEQAFDRNGNLLWAPGFKESLKTSISNLAVPAAKIVPETLKKIGDTAAFLNRNVVNLGGGTNPEEMATHQAGEAIQNQLDRLPTEKDELEESLLGIDPSKVPTGVQMSESTGLPKVITTPISGATKAVAGLGKFLTSPEGIGQTGTSLVPGVGLVQRAKWIYDMAKGVGEAGGNLTERLKKFISNPSATTDEDYQGLAEDTANTALMLYGAGKLSSHEVSQLTGIRAPLGRITETKRARFAKDMAEQLDKEPGNFNPATPITSPAESPAASQERKQVSQSEIENAVSGRIKQLDESVNGKWVMDENGKPVRDQQNIARDSDKSELEWLQANADNHSAIAERYNLEVVKKPTAQATRPSTIPSTTQADPIRNQLQQVMSERNRLVISGVSLSDPRVQRLDATADALIQQNRNVANEAINKAIKKEEQERFGKTVEQQPATTGEPNASAKPISESIPEPEIRPPVGEGTPLRQQGEAASPQEAGKANAPLDKTSGSEGIAQPPRVESLAERYDRLKKLKAEGKLTDPVDIENFEAQDKVQKQLAGQAAFAEMKAQLEKNAAKQKADLHARGYNESQQGKMTPEQKVAALKEEIPTLEADARRYWELRDKATLEPDQAKYLDLLKQNMAEIERIQHRNTKDQGQPPERPTDMGPEPVRQKTPSSAVQGTGTPPTVAPEQGANPPVVGEQPAAPVKRTKAEITKDREDFGILVGEQGEGFIPNFDLEQYEAARLKLGKDSVANVGLSNYFREVNKVILEKLGYDKNVRQTDALLAEALPKFRKYLEEQAKKEEGGVETDVSNTNVDESWNPEPPAAPPESPGDVGPGLGAAKVEEVAPAGTGLKNAIGDIERELHGLPETYQKEIRKMPVAWQESADILAKDPQAGKKLADELKHNPERGMTDTDSALLLRHKVALENAKNQAAEDTITGKTPEARAEAQQRFDDLSLQLTDLLDAAKFRGSQWGREGRWRQALAFEDYSLETMVSDKQVELGRKLTPTEHAEVQKMQKRIAELEKQLADKKVKDATGEKAGAVDESVDAAVKKAKAQKARDKAAGVERDLAAEEKEALDYLKESFGENGDFRDTQNVIRKLMELLAESGVHERLPMEDAIHRFLQGIDPRITREQAQDLMSNYGQSRLPSQKPAKVIVRDINAQILSVRKLLDYFQGKRPKLTGQLRDVPSQIQRNLLKMVNEAKKSFKLEGPTDSAKAIKSALDAVNTRLKNRLADLKQEVVTRRKIIRERSPSPYNEETLRLKREIEEIQKQHAEIFGTEMTDAQRLALAEKSADRQIAELERQIKTGEIFPKSKEEFNLRSEKLDAVKARLEELKLERKFAREASQPRPEREVRQGEARIKALDKKIAEIERQLKLDEVFAKGKRVRDPATDPRIIAREEKLNALKAEREYARERNQPGLEPNEAFLLNYQQRLRRMASEYQDRLARGDFEPKPKRVNHPNAETMKLQAQLEKAKLDFRRSVEMDRLNKRTPTEKVLEQISGAARASALSGYHTLAKLAGYSAARLGEIPLREAVGAAIGRVPGFRRIFAGANMESGSTLRSLGKLYSTAATKGLKQAAEIMRKGESADKLLYEKPYITPPRWYDFFGRLHQAEKAPLRAGSQAMYYERAYENAIKQGLDVNDEFVKAQINKEAYDYANREILMENNKFAKIVNAGLGLLEKKNPKTGKVEIQNAVIATLFRTFLTKGIVRTPANYIAQTIARTPIGLTAGLARAAHGHFRGIDNLHPVEKNAIASLVKVGAVGSAFFLWGMIDATQDEKDRVFGGYYSPGRKKGGRDVDWGKLRVDGTTLPHIVTHNPLTESAQMGSTLMRVFLSRSKKGKDTSTAALDAGVKSLVGLVSKAPITNPIMRLDSEGHRVVGGFIQGLVPQLIQNIAEDTDFNKDGMIERNPQSALDEVSVGIPGLRQTVKKK